MRIADVAVALVLSVFAGAACAQTPDETCSEDVYRTVSRSLDITNLSPRQDGGNVISAACRVWPYQTHLTLAALAYDEGVEYEKQLVVVAIDTRKKRVIASHRSPIAEDAITEVGASSLRLDTARYQLADNVRAFGVRFNSSARGASCGEGYWGNELTLFVPEQKTLRPVLTLSMYQQQWLEGCPASTSRAFWEDAALSASLGSASSHGFRDIVITAQITVSSEGETTAKSQDRIERHTLRYDGKTYQKGPSPPWWMGF